VPEPCCAWRCWRCCGGAAHVGSDHNVTDPGIESVTWTEAAALGRNGEEAYVELHVGDSLVFLGGAAEYSFYMGL